jgi:hypothetical protein
VNTGAGNDTITIGAATALSSTGNVLNGSTGTDTLTFYALGASEDVNLSTLVTAGTIAGIEAVNFVNANDSAHAITAGTGIVSYTVDTSNNAEAFTITATAAQANAITSLVDTTGTGDLNLAISDAGTVSLSGDTTTNLTAITWGTTALDLTLNNTANTVTQTGGTATNTVTAGSTTIAGQSITLATTGVANFNVTAAALTTESAAGDVADFTLVSAAAATTTLNITGAGSATAIFIQDADLVFTTARLDLVTVGGVTSAQTFNYGTGLSTTVATDAGIEGVTVNAAETGSTQVSYTFATDSAGTADTTLTITGFDVGASGDVIDLSGTGDAVTSSVVATTGFGLGAAVAAANIVTNVILGLSASQITGALTQTGDAGAVEAAIIAAGLATSVGNASLVYVTLDNGVDTGIYRINYDEAAADGANAGVLNLASEISGVTLVAVLTGVADCSTLVAGNII